MTPGAATGSVRTWLRVEGLALLAAGLWWYAASGQSWGTFVLWFLAPDLSFAGYLAGARVGAIVYNATHALVGPLALAAVGLATGGSDLLPLSAIWIAHVGFDRMLGYGLKYPSAFGDTHLGRLGRTPPASGA
jgi:hypothetical protein